jgi:2-methylcitrate dehydratase PrpD
MTLKTTDGGTLEKHVEHAVGSLERPLTNAELEDKYRQLTKGILPAAQADRLLAMAWRLETGSDASQLVRLGKRQTEGDGG